MEFLVNGPEKPVCIWSRVGRRPIFSAGNANGDLATLGSSEVPGRPALRLVVLHDDGDREFEYTAGAEQVLEAARDRGWVVVSVKKDWKAVFAASKRPLKPKVLRTRSLR